MTRAQIIEAVVMRMDEVTPSASLVDMRFGEITGLILQSVADEYALLYPVPSTQVKSVGLAGFITSELLVGGMVLVPTTSSFGWLALFEIETFGKKLRTFLPVTSKKRMLIERGVLVPTEENPVVFVSLQDSKFHIEILPEPTPGFIVRYVSTFDPTSIPSSGDRGFFDNFIWFLCLRTLQTIGGSPELAASIQGKVDSHFEQIKLIPS